MKRLFAIVAVMLSGIGMSPAVVGGKEVNDKLVLVCSTTQIADFTRQIVGDRCVVKSILAPGADPHTA